MKKFIVRPSDSIESIQLLSNSITCSISSRDISKNLIKTKSSNIDSFGMNVKEYGDKVGDVVVKFKPSGKSPSDTYIYYDVPIRLWQKWQSAPSKGHFFWKYIRNYYKYRKLTGDKRTHLANGL